MGVSSRVWMSVALLAAASTPARAQRPEPEPPHTIFENQAAKEPKPLQPDEASTVDPSSPTETRQGAIETAAADKAKALHPYRVSTAERIITTIENRLTNQVVRWHPYFQTAYSGGGFSPGVGYMLHTSAYSTLDVRGTYSITSYKLAEAEFISPRLFDRRGELTVIGGWRDATEVGFYGFGMNTSTSNRANYRFEEPFGSALLTIRPTRRLLIVRSGFEASRWDLKSGRGAARSVDEVYTPETLPGLGTKTTYWHTQATVGFDSREFSGYARRGGFYGVTGHDYSDRDDALGFRRVDYEAIQHIPILRDTWTISLHGLATTTWAKGDQQVPFFMMPSLGGGSNLRGFSTFRFRDRHSLLLQAEWRIWGNRFLESAAFYDAGKVAARTSDLDLQHLKNDYGFGVRFHVPFATVLRVEVARSTEGTRLVFSTSPVF